MGLITKPPSWGSCTTNYNSTMGSTGASISGSDITLGASNADGSTVTLLSALAHDVELLSIAFGQAVSMSNTNPNNLIDIMIDRAGGTSWETNPFIPDLLAHAQQINNDAFASPVFYHFPIWIPAGASIGARGRTGHTATRAIRPLCWAFGDNANPGSWWCGQGVEAIGVDAANSKGTDHTAGTSSAFSSWTDFPASTTSSHKFGALQFGVGGEDSTSSTNNYYFEFGIGGVRIGPTILKNISSSEFGNTSQSYHGPIFKEVPAGTQFQIRAAAQGATAQALNSAIYGVY